MVIQIQIHTIWRSFKRLADFMAYSCLYKLIYTWTVLTLGMWQLIYMVRHLKYSPSLCFVFIRSAMFPMKFISNIILKCNTRLQAWLYMLIDNAHKRILKRYFQSHNIINPPPPVVTFSFEYALFYYCSR